MILELAKFIRLAAKILGMFEMIIEIKMERLFRLMAIITIHSMIQYSIDFMFADQIIELNSNFVEDLVLSFQKQII